jgi:hypothetical protein
MRERFARERFGEVIEINKEEWVREVTEASNSAVVVVHLYQDRYCSFTNLVVPV